MSNTFPQNIAAIRTAVYGKDVRAAIADSLEQTNNKYESVEDFVDQMSVLKYIDISLTDTNGFKWGDVNGDGIVNSSDLILVQRYVSGISINPRGNGTTAWKSCVNFDTDTDDITSTDSAIFATLQSKIVNVGDAIVRYKLTYADNHAVYLWGVIPGEMIASSQRAPQWFTGDKLSDEYTGTRIFNTSGIEYAIVGDMYLHTASLDRGNIYKCVVAGVPTVAQWIYAGNLIGDLSS